jgi:hypothetical protein
MGRYFNWLAMTSVNLSAQHLDNVRRRKVFSNLHLCNCMIITYSQLHCFTYNCTNNHVQPTALLHLSPSILPLLHFHGETQL